MAPPGWLAAKTVGVSRPDEEWRVSATLSAKLSPRASVMVVEVVGAEKPNEAVSDSWSVVGSRKFCPPIRAGWVRRGHVRGLVCAVMITRGMCEGICRTRDKSSGVRPEYVIMMMVSLGRMTPRSPWRASAG